LIIEKVREISDSFIHSFIHSGDLYRASSFFKTLLLRGALSPVTEKEEGLKEDVKFGRNDNPITQCSLVEKYLVRSEKSSFRNCWGVSNQMS